MQGFIGCMFAHSNVHENDQESVAASGLLVLPWISCLDGLAGTVLLWRELLANTVSFALMLFFGGMRNWHPHSDGWCRQITGSSKLCSDESNSPNLSLIC